MHHPASNIMQKLPLVWLFSSHVKPLCVYHTIWRQEADHAAYKNTSETHRTVTVGSDLWRSPALPPAQAGPPQAGCPGPCQVSSWRSPKRETPQPLWATCARAPSPAQQKSISWCSDRTSFCLCLLPPDLALGTAENRMALFAPSLQVFTYINKIPPPPNLLSSMLNSPSSLGLSSEERCSQTLDRLGGPSLDSLVHRCNPQQAAISKLLSPLKA